MKKLLVMLLALTLLAVPALAEVEYDEGNPPLSLEIYLKGNPTTGYDWSYTVSDPEVVYVLESDFMADSTEGLVGAGGTYYFRVDGLKSGVAEVAFTYSRSFEEGSAIVTTTYRVMVDEGLNVIVFENAVDV